MKDISFIIPSIRPYFGNASIVIDSIINTMINETYKYEIILISPEKPPIVDKLKWINEEKIGGTLVKACNNSIPYCDGEYLFFLNDKWKTNKKILNAIPFLESDLFKNRKFKVTSINVESTFRYGITDMPIKGGSKLLEPYLPLELLQDRFLKPQHRYSILGFPVATKSSIKEHLQGYIFNPRFINHYADNWLGFYIGEMGEFPLVCPDTWMEVFGGPGISKDDVCDFTTFCDLAKNLINKVNINYV